MSNLVSVLLSNHCFWIFPQVFNTLLGFESSMYGNEHEKKSESKNVTQHKY